MNRFIVSRRHTVAAAILLFVEIGIALFVRDRFVRPYLGDVLAVILVYCGLRALFPLGAWQAAVLAFGVATAIEFGQLIGILDLLGLRGNPIARTVLGSGFDWTDFLAYGAGATIPLLMEGRK
ncbi:MAG: DUF2809 domain-containing protein [Sphingomonas sp.]